MVLLVSGVPLEEAPQSVGQLYLQFGQLREGARLVVDKRREVVGPTRSLYVSVREFAVTHSQDSKVEILGTDNLVNNVAIIMKNTASGSTLMSHVDRLTTDDLETMTSALITDQAYSGNNRLQISIIGAFQDNKNVSQSQLIPVLAALQSSPVYLEVATLCVGECMTVVRDGTPLPLLSGVGVNVKTGDIFPAVFREKGPDMDIRTARTLTGGEKVGMFNIYDCVREELTIGPFTYSPMRAVDIWLQQTDQFLLQSLSPCPEAVEDREQFTSQLRATLRMIKEHPYPSVTLFPSNMTRAYRKDSSSGVWVSKFNSNTWYGQQYIKSEAIASYKTDTLCYKMDPLGYKTDPLSYKSDPSLNLNFHFKHEAMPWQSMQLQPQAYY